MTSIDQEQLLSHSIATEAIDARVKRISDRIETQGDKPHATIHYQLELLEQLSQVDLGRFLLQNQGVNGYWTHYVVTHPWLGRKTNKNSVGESFSDLESFLLNRAPSVLATQERFELFLQENKKSVKNHAKLACIPCGMMGELLYLDFNNYECSLVGIDCDAETLKDAQKLAEQKELSKYVSLQQADAWDLDAQNEFDLISSNGLTIYESDGAKVKKLYELFHLALKPGGKLVTSFLTPPPALTDACEWDMSKINKDDLMLQAIIFVDIVGAKWQSFRSTEQTKELLVAAGFNEIEFLYDNAKMFPTVVACKN